MFRKISLHCVLNLCKNKIDIDVPTSLDINQKMEKSRICENSLDENILIPSQYKSLQKILDSIFKIPVTIVRTGNKIDAAL